MKLIYAVTTGAALAGLSVTAMAHEGATGVVKERMDAMKSMGEAIKQIKPMMTGEAAYDAEAIRAAAEAIAAEAGGAMTGKFPEGSNAHPSEADPKLWDEWARFEEMAAHLEIAARGLALSAENGLHGDGHMMSGQSGMMGNSMMSGQSGMMGGSMMGMQGWHEGMTAEHIGQMPADAAFTMMSQTCSACHDSYRKDDS